MPSRLHGPDLLLRITSHLLCRKQMAINEVFPSRNEHSCSDECGVEC